MKCHSLAAAFGALSMVGTVHSDPPVLPPVGEKCKVFCFRITDIRAHPNDPGRNKFSFEFEVLNWSNTFAGGVLLVLAEDSSAGIRFARDNFFNLNGVDKNGRPIRPEDTNGDMAIDALDLEDDNLNGLLDAGEDQNGNNRLDNDPIPGNLNRPNDWTLIDQTATRMEWRLGTPIPFINLVETDKCSDCIKSIEQREGFPERMVTVDTITGEVNPPEAIDDGDNVQDGFVMTVNGMDVGDTIHMNWFLLGAGDATTPFESNPPKLSCRKQGPNIPVGQPIGVAGNAGIIQGNPMGFGMITITRVDGIPRPGPVFVGNIGVRQTGVEFFDNVFYVPDDNANRNSVIPDQSGFRRTQEESFNDTFTNSSPPGTFALMAMEFAANATACAEKNSDLPKNSTGDSAPVNIKKINGKCGGDPHFTTWSGERYDFHGECDLVLVQNPDFANGLGMHIHGRTKIHRDWSAFESAAIKIGDDVLEIHGQSEQWINGVDIEFPAFIGGYSVTMQQPAKHIRRFIVHLGNGERIFIKTFNEFVYLEMEGSRTRNYAGANGMLGSFEIGHKVARDTKTIIVDPVAFGMEWQVRDTDPQLFHLVEGPQYPERCKMPDHAKTESINRLRRNLKSISKEDAKKACSKAGAAFQEDCIADVIATHNLEMAGAY